MSSFFQKKENEKNKCMERKQFLEKKSDLFILFLTCNEMEILRKLIDKYSEIQRYEK